MDNDLTPPATRGSDDYERNVGCAKPFGSGNQSVTAWRDSLQFESSVGVGLGACQQLVISLSEQTEARSCNPRLMLGTDLDDGCSLNCLHFQGAVINLVMIFVGRWALARVPTLLGEASTTMNGQSYNREENDNSSHN
jgi:hypothetical protein